jgi:hypothetical protein
MVNSLTGWISLKVDLQFSGGFVTITKTVSSSIAVRIDFDHGSFFLQML